MSSGNQPRKRSDLVATVKLPARGWARGLRSLTQADFWARLGLCVAAVGVMGVLAGGWKPQLTYRQGDVPRRNITARTRFQVVDAQQTRRAKERARETMLCVYWHDVDVLPQLRLALQDKLFQILRAETLDQVDPEVWQEFSLFSPQAPAPGDQVPAQLSSLVTTSLAGAGLAAPPSPMSWVQLRKLEFQAFRQAFSEDARLDKFNLALTAAMTRLERDGLLDKLQHDLYKGSQTEIKVYPRTNPADVHRVLVRDVLLGEATMQLQQRLKENLASPIVAQTVYKWLRERLTATLTLDVDATREEEEQVENRVAPVMVTYQPGDLLAPGGQPVDEAQMALLEAEHQQLVETMGWFQRLRYAAARFGMYVAVFVLCGAYLHFRSPQLLADFRSLARLIALAVVTVVVAHQAARGWLQAELIPLLLFGMTVVIAYQQELAILLSAAMALLVVLSLGLHLEQLVVFFASMATAILLLRRIRSRTKLLQVGLAVGLVAALTSLGIHSLEAPVVGRHWLDPVLTGNLQQASWYGFHAILAALLMTGLLPYIERIFDVQTELSLLELGDMAHPLLQELVRRAPGTFNHSMNVASMAEAAAEAIGANGLLVRVGAYFHDIGKMLKPSYFVENQPRHQNRHESLLPAMSTLIIIAHVKDGADLARQHNLPNSIIDFIRQHHGTTLVEYFYQRASEQSEVEPGSAKVDEGTYRYPGPKPRTQEAAVLMMADAVESAGRSLADPTPAKIEGLVHELAMKRLLDGQFDECGLTLKDLRAIEVSLTKSLSAVCHGRIRYPDQQTA